MDLCDGYYLYCIENKINGSLYIGKSKNPYGRWSSHKSITKAGKNKAGDRYSYIHKAMNKYGIENFEFFIFQYCSDESESFEFEKFWIHTMKEYAKVYNLTLGGDGASGLIHTEEAKALMKKNRNPRKGKDHPLFGVGHKEESIALMKRKAIGRSVGDKNPMYGVKGEKASAYGRTGEKHPNCKLSDIQMLELREELKNPNITLTSLAKKYNISIALVSCIKSGKRRSKN